MVKIFEVPNIIAQEEEFKEKVVQIRRVAKVVKGGKRMSFRALVVVGDGKGRVGIGVATAGDVSSAIRKSVEHAHKGMVTVPLVGRTIPYQVVGIFGASRVLLRPAQVGRGVIAGGAIRPVLELSGIKDVVAKRIGGGSAINIARAALDGITQLGIRDAINRDLGRKSTIPEGPIAAPKTEEEKVTFHA